MDGEPQAGRADLATRGAQGPAAPAKARPPVAQRWIMHPAAAGISRPCMGLRLRRGAYTHDGRKFRILTIIAEASRECLALIVARQLRQDLKSTRLNSRH